MRCSKWNTIGFHQQRVAETVQDKSTTTVLHIQCDLLPGRLRLLDLCAYGCHPFSKVKKSLDHNGTLYAILVSLMVRSKRHKNAILYYGIAVNLLVAMDSACLAGSISVVHLL